ncbi:Receptor-like serine/threonine-protein kinase [Heracleum sosnowskyi]|uniref:non-specific serine/threonine protein kinase n=1 Tax=Heracleum sosnowskyi TaxID=360622 RepID=A0AAD8ISD0_9APIA|nr:Receptor-like serine/threonine-protein kinase [Heracleum sosnowskyi]
MECTCTNLVLFSTIWLLFSISTDSSSVDVLRIDKTIRDGDTLVSANGEFELGFFSPGRSMKRYVGIWFKKISQGTTVWVANRDAPPTNTSGILMIGKKAISLLDNSTSTSFDFPGDTILSGMKLGVDSVRGLRWEHSSWKSDDDPSPGSYVHRIDVHGYPQLLLWKNSELHTRSGPWVGNRFSGDPLVKPRIYKNEFIIGQKEIYYISHAVDKSSNTPATRVILTPNGNLRRQDCRSKCLKNCSCTAYSSTNVEKDGGGCLLWFEALMDITGYTEYGQDIYVRMPASMSDKSKRSRVNPLPFICISVVLTLISSLVALYLFKKKRLRLKGRLNSFEETMELPLFEFKRVANATCNFSRDNKIGEGGFGPVYKGLLEDGQLIAVKRLSESSRQGIDEFKNEVSLIAKLQHRNLVSLLGYCTEEGERILIYEYMTNKSLDSFIFDKELSKLADWRKLYQIINGVARGLLYLHQDSKLRIIHRDLKASNVLLDDEMNPKISDFGMARSFGGSQTEANTTRVVGTYGYMPPEYVIDGVFSVKSDVYSFGVLVLEIVTGKKNRCFEHPDHNLNLLGHAWRCFNEQKLEELVDGAILESSQHEVFQVIQIGLLSVQEYPEDRPDMSSVVLMLNSKTALSKPKHPGFFTARKRHANDYSPSEPMLSSSNDYSITMVAPR